MNIDLGSTQSQLDWLKQKLYLNAIAPSSAKRTVKRGQVYRCNLGIGVGSEMQKERPCVIVQQNIANLHSPNTFVVPITHDSAILPSMIPILPQTDGDGNIILDGYANVSNLTCVSKARLGDLIGSLSKSEMKLIDEAIAKAFEIIHYYADIQKKLRSRLNYTEKIKEDRNKAEDTLKSIQQIIVETTDSEEKIEKIKNLLETT